MSDALRWQPQPDVRLRSQSTVQNICVVLYTAIYCVMFFAHRLRNGRSALVPLLTECSVSRQCRAMKTAVRMLLVLRLLSRPLAVPEDVRALSELPLSELLAQRRIVEEEKIDQAPSALAFTAESSRKLETEVKLRESPKRKTFYEEDYEDEKIHLAKKKHKHKVHDILNTSIMALSYLAFGGYLLCMIASAVREKRRRYALAYPTAAPTANNQIAQVLHQYMNQRPGRPFIRFPTVTVHQGGKRRRRRFTQTDAPMDASRNISVTDYVEKFIVASR